MIRTPPQHQIHPSTRRRAPQGDRSRGEEDPPEDQSHAKLLVPITSPGGCSKAVHTSSPRSFFNTSLNRRGPHLPEDCHNHPHPQNASTVTGLNDYRPVALTPIVMKCFERLVMAHIKDCVDATFADDTAVVGRIANNDESDYRQEVEHLEGWCRQNNLCINVKKTKEMIVDFRRGRHLPSPLYIGGTAVEVVSSFRHIIMRHAGLGSSVLTSFYRCVVESVLSSCSCSAAEKKALQRVVKAAQRTVGRSLPTTMDIYTSRCRKRASCIMKDPTHTAHTHCLSPSPQAGGCRSIKEQDHQTEEQLLPESYITSEQGGDVVIVVFCAQHVSFFCKLVIVSLTFVDEDRSEFNPSIITSLHFRLDLITCRSDKDKSSHHVRHLNNHRGAAVVLEYEDEIYCNIDYNVK
ncbi:hypothetical protein L3Q82_007452 [Scortum barcoo]|uniref:Uncharacterized protein n=1 Tax=Scortum barcoo TaxID=214431 RepID=A0ACB8WNB1_9TELE|nr:hypothetical protein L3Q82_007452 [Scortum barcoo]